MPTSPNTSGGRDLILDAIGPVSRALEADEEPFCVTCEALLGMFAADGAYYRHYRHTEDGDSQRYSVDRPNIIGWRPPTSP